MRLTTRERREGLLCTPVVQLLLGEADARQTFLQQLRRAIRDGLPVGYVPRHATKHCDYASVAIEDGDCQSGKH